MGRDGPQQLVLHRVRDGLQDKREDEQLKIELQAIGVSSGGTRAQRLSRVKKCTEDDYRKALQQHGLLGKKDDQLSGTKLTRRMALVSRILRKSRVVVVAGQKSLP